MQRCKEEQGSKKREKIESVVFSFSFFFATLHLCVRFLCFAIGGRAEPYFVLPLRENDSMPDPIIFSMGTHTATLPIELTYCRGHLCYRPLPEDLKRFYFSAYAVKLMRDVYFLEWRLDNGATVAKKDEIGFIETSKATSELYAPIAGVITTFSPEAIRDPGVINVDNYGDGWLFEMRGDDPEPLTAEEYRDFLEKSWEQTQRLIKGQMHGE